MSERTVGLCVFEEIYYFCCSNVAEFHHIHVLPQEIHPLVHICPRIQARTTPLQNSTRCTLYSHDRVQDDVMADSYEQHFYVQPPTGTFAPSASHASGYAHPSIGANAFPIDPEPAPAPAVVQLLRVDEHNYSMGNGSATGQGAAYDRAVDGPDEDEETVERKPEDHELDPTG